MGPINTDSPNLYLGAVLCYPVHIGIQTGYSETHIKTSMLLLPLNSSRVVEHEQMSILSSYHHM